MSVTVTMVELEDETIDQGEDWAIKDGHLTVYSYNEGERSEEAVFASGTWVWAKRN